MVKKRKKIYIQNKDKNKMLYSKIHKKISLGEYSSLRKKKTENHFNLGNHKKTLGVNQKKGVNNKGSER